MSLILEALKKLDREKQAPERGFVVLGAAPWGSRERPGRLAVGALVAIAMGVGIALAVALRRPPAPVIVPHAAPPAVARVPLPSPVAAAGPARPSSAPHAPPAARTSDAATTSRSAAAPPAPSPVVLRLVAISQRDGHPVALLNDRLVREGDRFDGVTVIRIGSDEVEVEVGGHRRVIGF